MESDSDTEAPSASEEEAPRSLPRMSVKIPGVQVELELDLDSLNEQVQKPQGLLALPSADVSEFLGQMSMQAPLLPVVTSEGIKAAPRLRQEAVKQMEFAMVRRARGIHGTSPLCSQSLRKNRPLACAGSEHATNIARAQELQQLEIPLFCTVRSATAAAAPQARRQ